MRRLIAITLLAGAALPAAVAGALPAHTAASKYVSRSDEVSATVHKSGTQGTTLVYKGTVHSKLFGTGKVTEKVMNLGLNGTLTVVYAKGTVRGKSTAKPKAQPDGTFTVTGTYELTGGTGRYAHVRGKGTFTGTSTANLQTATFKQKGTVSGLPAKYFAK